jgi:hypothetical protein
MAGSVLAAGEYSFEVGGTTIRIVLEEGQFGGPEVSVTVLWSEGSPHAHVWAEGDLVLGPECVECGQVLPDFESDTCSDCGEES